jgi:serine/threonine protein phosphatase PrpC
MATPPPAEITPPLADLRSVVRDLTARVHALEAENARLSSLLAERGISPTELKVLELSRQLNKVMRAPRADRKVLPQHVAGNKLVSLIAQKTAVPGSETRVALDAPGPTAAQLRANPEILSMRHIEFGLSILHLAAIQGATQICSALIDEFRMDPSCVDLLGRTPLHLAAENLQEQTCQALVARMGDVLGEHAPRDMAGVTPAAVAAASDVGNRMPGTSSRIARSLHRLGDPWVSPRPTTTSKPARALQQQQQQHAVRFGHCEMNGFRADMQDCAVQIVSKSHSLFAVFDGHGGARCAQECQAHLPLLFRELQRQGAPLRTPADLSNACEQLCRGLEEHLQSLPEFQLHRVLKRAAILGDPAEYEDKASDSSGSTCLLALLSDSHVALANIGDSRAAWFVDTDPRGSARDLTVDQKAEPRPEGSQEAAEFCAAEKARVLASGCAVTESGAVVLPSGVRLAMTRSLGDFYGKPWAISAQPVITVVPRQDHAFIVLACDGIWDVLSARDAALTLAEDLRDLDGACARLCQTSLQPALDPRNPGEVLRPGSNDNLTATLIDISLPLTSADAVREGRVLRFDGVVEAL